VDSEIAFSGDFDPADFKDGINLANIGMTIENDKVNIDNTWTTNGQVDEKGFQTFTRTDAATGNVITATVDVAEIARDEAQLMSDSGS
jgi:hypothetical protein